MVDSRICLPIDTLLKLDNDEVYKIIGEPIGYSGSSILYPAKQLSIQHGVLKTSEMQYVIKECYPTAFIRNNIGAIVPHDGNSDDIHYLQRAQLMQLEEGKISQKIYQTSSRILPIRSSSQNVCLTFPGHPAVVVPNTITVMDSMTEKSRPLSAWIKERGHFTPTETFRITQQLLFALREVHQANYLHLDLHDSNLFVIGGNLKHKKDELVTLFDFGCAREMIDGKTAPIHDKVIFTTPGFSAPEILLHNDGNLQLGPETDIFSVGCIIYFLLTGLHANVSDFIENRTGIYLQPNQIRRIKCPKHLIDSLQQILSMALAPDPENRYHSVDAMLDDVTALLEALQPYRPALRSVKYDAFICYKHGPVDSIVARALQCALEKYRAPKGVCEQKKPFRRVFLDECELSSSPDYKQQLDEALKNSAWLILISSPDTPLSSHVEDEINTFLKYHDRSRILAVLTGGNPETSFPTQLRGNIDGTGEVFAAHAIGKTAKDVVKKLKDDALLKIAAPMLGTTFDTLKQRHKIYQLQRIAAVTAGFLLISVCFAAYAINRAKVIAEQAIRIEEEYRQALTNESLFLAEQAQKRLDNDDPLGAIELALQALPSEIQDRPALTEAEYVLGKALDIYTTPGSNYDTVTATGKIETGRNCFLLDDAGDYLFIWDTSKGGIQVWDAESMLLIGELYPDNTLGEYKPISIMGNNIIVKHIHQIISVDFLTGKENWSIEEENLVSVEVSDDKQHVLIFSRNEYGGDDDKSKDPDTLYLDIISAENGKVLRQMEFPLEAQFRMESEVCISEDERLIAIRVHHKNSNDILYPNHSLYVLNLETGSCQHVFDSDTNIRKLQFYGDKIAVIRSRGLSITTIDGKRISRAVYEATAYFEAYDLYTWERQFSYEYQYYSKHEGICAIGLAAYNNRFTAGTGLLFTMEDRCFLLDQETGMLVQEYTLPASAVSIRYTQNGFITINADGSMCAGKYTENSIFVKKYWKDDVTKVFENGNCFFIQHTPFGINMDYTIRRYQKDLYDNGYTAIANLGNSNWRFYTCCTTPEGIRTILKGNDQVCMVDVNGQVYVHSLPEAWSFDAYSEPVGISEDGTRLYISAADWDKDSLWIHNSRYYMVDLISGDIRELPYPKLDGISYVGDSIFEGEKLFFKAQNSNTNKEEFYVWHMEGNTIGKICSISPKVSGGGYAFSSMRADTENNRLYFVTEQGGTTSAPQYLISADISSGEMISVPIGFLEYPSDYFPWYDHPYVCNQSGTLVCIDWGDSLYIVDSDGKQLQHINVNREIIDIRFSLDEELLFVFAKDGSITRYRISDGECVGEIQLSDYRTFKVTFFDAMNWEMTYLNENCLLIITSQQSFLLDISGMELRMKAVIDHCIAYDAQCDHFVVADLDGPSYELGTIPRYTLEELIQKGNAVMGSNSQH